MTVIPNPPTLGDKFTNDTTGVSYEYDGEKWVITSTPGSENADQLDADLAALTSRVSDGEGVQGQIQETISDALDTQSEIQEDVSTLEAKVDALEATVLDGKWQMDVRSVAGAGKFLALGLGGPVSEWSDTIKLQMHPVSYEGKSYTFAEVSVEDVVRIGYSNSMAAFKITTPFVQSGDVYEANVQLLSSEGQPFGSVIYDFEFLPSFDPSAYASIDYVDEQDEKAVKKAGTSTVTDNFRIKTESKSFISLNGDEMRLYHVADPTGQDDAWAANKGYVDTAVAPLSTRDYVDQAVADAVEPDLSGYLRKSEFYHYNRAPAVLSWKFNSTSSGDSAPPDGSFKITDNGGDKYFRLSFKTSNGADLGDAAFSDTRVTFTDGPVGTVWYWNYEVEKWRLKEQFRINFFRWNYNNHFEMRTSSRHGNKSYTPGTSYYITVGGFF